jgi:hypothetical protein
MTTTISNQIAVNNLLRTFRDSFNFGEAKETILMDRKKRILQDIFAVTSIDTFVTLRIVFKPQEEIQELSENYMARLVFNTPYMLKEEYLNIQNIMVNMYKPEFDKVVDIVDWFVDEGIKSAVINVVDKKGYAKHIKENLNLNTYSSTIATTDKNIAIVYFNNILQKGEGRHNQHFKKSYINVELVYLIHSDNTMHPYFKIRLPYFDTKKISCVMPLGASNKVYMYTDDKQLATQYIDKQQPFDLVEADMRSYFKNLFDTQVVRTLSNKLKINKKELAQLSQDQLKEYFIIAEMVSI